MFPERSYKVMLPLTIQFGPQRFRQEPQPDAVGPAQRKRTGAHAERAIHAIPELAHAGG